jgi:thiamine-monophosphate kinase
VAGGNVTRARQLSLTVTALGSVRPGALLRRKGARVGDAVLVSGTLGDAALGLERGASPSLLRRQRRPEPRIALGRALAGIATAAIDLSDGLVQDLGHLCRASGVGASVRLAELPLSPAYRRAVRGRADPWAAALSGGEDYELAVTAPVLRVPQALRAARRAGATLSVVGSIVRGTGVQVVRCEGGVHPPLRGHDHLARAPRSLTSPGEPLGSVLP